MRESKVERHLKERVEALGGKCWKFTSPGLIGVPDRMVMHPDHPLVFVETKAPDGTLSSPQRRRHVDLLLCGQTVVVCRTVAMVDRFIRSYKKGTL